MFQGQFAKVEPFPHDHPRVAPELCDQLAVADIDGIDHFRARLQQHLGEATGRRAGVQHPGGDGDARTGQRPHELVGRPGDVVVTAGQLDRIVADHGLGRTERGRAVDQHSCVPDRFLGLRA